MTRPPSERHRHDPDRPSGSRVRGTVRWFDAVHGVGEVRVPGRGHVHVYYKEIVDEGYRALDAGDTVSFWIDDTGQGPVLREVRLESSLPRE